MTGNLPYIRMIAILAIVLFLVTGCSDLSTTEYLVSATETSGKDPNIQSSPSTTATVTSTFTPTALPTLSPTQIVEGIRQMYESNGGCELPCLWGIVPGKTRFQEIQEKFEKFGTFRDITRTVDNFQTVVFTTSVPDDLVNIYNDEKWSFHLRLENDVVVGLLTGVTVIEEFSNPSLATFLVRFGRPEEVWIGVIPDQIGLPDYSIILYYPSKGIFINWRDTADSVISENDDGIEITACPQHIPTEADTMIGSYPPYFYLVSPDLKLPLNELVAQHLSKELYYRLLDDAKTDEFYSTYLDPNTQVCLPFSYP